MPRKDLLRKVKRIVVKIGTSSLTENGIISEVKISRLVLEIIKLMKSGYEVVLVSSGAISAGCGEMGKDRGKMSIPEKQAYASIGQTVLMNQYRRLFKDNGYSVGQILMTEEDVKNRLRFLNLRNTINTLLSMKVVPIINENDSVAIKEIKFGDNDTLSAHVTNLTGATLLIILSDIDGFYNDLKDPAPLESVRAITKDIYNKAGGEGSSHGTGGMYTKIKAADMILKSGEMMIIAKADFLNVLTSIMKGEKIGTIFAGDKESMPNRKRWMAFNMKSSGKIIVDSGAAKALLEKKKSLLPIGVTGTSGNFKTGDGVEICDVNGQIIGKGISNYSRDELEKIKGKKTTDIKKILGRKLYDEIVHRDNMVIY